MTSIKLLILISGPVILLGFFLWIAYNVGYERGVNNGKRIGKADSEAMHLRETTSISAKYSLLKSAYFLNMCRAFPEKTQQEIMEEIMEEINKSIKE